MKHNRLLSFVVACTLGVLAGCSTSTGTLSRQPAAYLSFTGALPSDSVQIDELPPVQLPEGRQPLRLQVSPGKHRVKVFRGQILLMDRAILVSDLQTLELIVPR